jgi:hypothetical protein
MSWWKKLCIGVAVSFFEGLLEADPQILAVAKPYALQIFKALKIAYAGDPDFK